MNVATVLKVDIGSDHCLVRAKIWVDKKFERLKMLKRPNKRRIDVKKLSEQQPDTALN